MIILYIALNPDTYIHTCTNMQSAERVIKKKKPIWTRASVKRDIVVSRLDKRSV